jgi:TPR repeat protein
MATNWYEKAAAQGNSASMAILGKNDVAKGGIAFSYQAMRLSAAKQIPAEYAKRILLTK